MFIDGRSVDRDAEIHADVCIVGAGAAGITLARDLMASGHAVALIESGGLEPDAATQQLAAGSNAGFRYHDLVTSRLRYFGGTTNHWSGWCRPLDAIDFMPRDWIDGSGWPLSRQDLADYYPPAQSLCQIGVHPHDPAAWHIDPAALLPLDGDAFETNLIQFSPPTRFGATYRAELERSTVKVFLNTTVHSLVANANASAVTAARVVCLNGNRFTLRAKTFVCAAGGLENARLLLLSNSVAANGLGNDRDLVGRYFMNHLHLPGGAFVLSRGTFDTSLYTRRAGYRPGTAEDEEHRLMGYLAVTPPAQQRHAILNCSANVRPIDASEFLLSGGEPDPDWLETLRNAAGNFDELAAFAFSKVYSKFDPEARLRMFELVNITEQSPNPDSRIYLGDELDALGQRMTVLDWRLQEIDRRTMRVMHELFAQQISRHAIGRFFGELSDDDSAWPAAMNGDWHHMGTTRMSHDPRDGVVNAECRVHGVENLYMAGSSVFATSGYSNPTLTLVALALRLGKHLRTVI